MDRDRQTATDIEAMRRRRLRVAAMLVCAGLTVVALWAARVPQVLFVDRTADTAVEQVGNAEPVKPDSAAKTDKLRASIAKPLPGLDSSLSPVPKRLYLVATSPGRNAKEGTARLGTSRENPQSYVAGAVLVNGARLAEIYADRVILERRGQRTTLYVGTSADGGIAGSKDLAMVGGQGTQPPAAAPTLAADSLFDVVRAMPFYENEGLAGVQVFAGQKTSQFAALGLQSQDVILSIDGAPVFDAGVAVDRLRALTAGAALTVTVRRGKETKRLSLDGAALAKSPSQSAGLQPDFPGAPLP